jgi:iron(III) transport system permease protein
LSLLTPAGARRQYRSLPPWWLIATALVPIVLIALPLVYVVNRATEAGWDGIRDELFRAYTYSLLTNTLVLAVSVTLGASIIGTAVAWCVERTDLPGRKIWRVVASLPLAVPAFVSSFAWASIGNEFQNMAGAILVLILASYPLVYLPVAAALRGMDTGFEDVSRSLGRGPWHTFFFTILPQARPALGGGALLVLSHMLAEFGALSLLRVQTFTTAIFASYELRFDNVSAALQAGVLLVLALFAAYTEMRMRAGTRHSRVGKGAARQPSLAALGRATPAVVLGQVVLSVLALGVPLAALVYWLFVGNSAGHGLSEVWPAIWGSGTLSIAGAVVTTLLALPLVLLATRFNGRLARFADRLPYVIHGLPGLVIALALVFFSIHYVPAIYQTVLVLILAYAVLALPLAQTALRASVALVPPRLEEISRSLGRGPFKAFVSVTLPNIAPGIGAALALLALELMRELTATLMLAPTDVVTLATEVWSHTNDAEYAAAAPFAALLVLVSAIPVYVFTRRTLEAYEIT